MILQPESNEECMGIIDAHEASHLECCVEYAIKTDILLSMPSQYMLRIFGKNYKHADNYGS